VGTIAAIVVITIAVGTLVAFAIVAWLLLVRARDAVEQLADAQRRLEPELALLARESAVAAERMERLAESAQRPGGPVRGDIH
jgi:hypothetical protein